MTGYAVKHLPAVQGIPDGKGRRNLWRRPLIASERVRDGEELMERLVGLVARYGVVGLAREAERARGGGGDARPT